MSRTSSDQYVNGTLRNGYDYTRQAWVIDGKYVRCGHPERMNCGCYGKAHEGEPVTVDVINAASGKAPVIVHTGKNVAAHRAVRQ